MQVDISAANGMRYAISIHTITTYCYRCLRWIAMKLTMVLRPVTEDALPRPARSNGEVMEELGVQTGGIKRY